MKKEVTPMKIRQYSKLSNPVHEAVQGNSRMANPINKGFRPEPPRLVVRTNKK